VALQLPVEHWTPASQPPPAGFLQTLLQKELQQSVEEPHAVPGWRQAPHWPEAERQRLPPQHSEAKPQPEPGERQQVRSPPSGRRGSHAMEQQSSPVAQLELPGKPWQVA